MFSAKSFLIICFVINWVHIEGSRVDNDVWNGLIDSNDNVGNNGELNLEHIEGAINAKNM